MGGHVPPRVTYWTGTWHPGKEAISKEIGALRVDARAQAPLVAYSIANRTRLSVRSRELTLAGHWWPVLRLAAAVVEPHGDVSHVFGGAGSWHLLRALGRRPILLTAVVAAGNVPMPYGKCARVVVESEAAVDEWAAAGVSRERIELVRPGIDLAHYRPSPNRPGRFTVLFASTPADAAEIDSRGVGLLMDLARARPDLDVLVPWRAWGDVDRAQEAIAARRPPSNFLLQVGDVTDMRQCYAAAHATVVCFAPGVGKTCPQFVVEGFASGLPCISSLGGGLADLIDRHQAGTVARRDVASLSAAVNRVMAEYGAQSAAARQLAEAEFDVRRFRAQYEAIYSRLSRLRSGS
jgi:glycosyltransferase involved in cell wall biosynthesis